MRAQLDAVFDDIGVDAAKTGMLFSQRLIETVADFLEEHPVPLVVDPVMVASSGAKLLLRRRGRDARRAALPARDGGHAEPARGRARSTGCRRSTRRELAERLHELGAPAVIVTGGHGDQPVDHLFDGERHVEIPVERHDVAATHGAGCTHSATLAAELAQGRDARGRGPDGGARRLRGGAERPRRARRGEGPVDVFNLREEPRELDAGRDARALRERKPLVHQITNYVVMNETANATLALGALPVMAHAREEVEEMVGLAGALVLNIGTLSPPWVEAMLARRQGGQRARASPSCSTRSAPARRATAPRRRSGSSTRSTSTVLRGNAGEVATLVGVEAEVRGVESIAAGGDPAELAREAARTLGVVASVTGAGRPRLGRRDACSRSRTGTSCSRR